jgi:hypothetical protein
MNRGLSVDVWLTLCVTQVIGTRNDIPRTFDVTLKSCQQHCHWLNYMPPPLLIILSRVKWLRRVLDWQSDLLHFTTKYNWVSLDSLRLTIHGWIYHNNSAVIVTSAALVTAELQVPFLASSASLSEIYDFWTDGREDTAFGIVGCLAITRKRVPSGLGLARYQATSTPRRARHNMLPQSILL